MFNANTNFIFILIIVSITKLLSVKTTSVLMDEQRNYSNKISEERRVVKNLVHSSILYKKFKDGVNSSKELYPVTFTDINGKEVRFFLNITALYDSMAWGLNKRARQDTYVKTHPSANPYSVMIFGSKSGISQGPCSGSLLTREWVLTAAHCFRSYEPWPDSILLYAGGYGINDILFSRFPTGFQWAVTKEYYVHPEFNKTSLFADISVVKAEPFSLTYTVNVVKLSSEPWSYRRYKECEFTGYGMVQINETNEDDHARKTHRLLMKKPCVCYSALEIEFWPKEVQWICTKPLEDHGLCPGDSGGGLICDGQVKAVTSGGFQIKNLKTCDFEKTVDRCASQNSVTFFQDTCPYLQWINSHVKLFKESEISSECKNTGSKGRDSILYILNYIFSYIIFFDSIY